MPSAVQQPSPRVHPFWLVLLAALAIGVLIALLWVTAAHGSLDVQKFLPWVWARTYGPNRPLYGGWLWLAAASVAVCLGGLAIAYLISLARRSRSRPDEGLKPLAPDDR